MLEETRRTGKTESGLTVDEEPAGLLIIKNQNKRYKKMNSLLQKFISAEQLAVLEINLKGEEKSYFKNLLEELENTLKTMPKTCEQDGKGENAIVYLHYFLGDFDWFIIERDVEPEQLQAFGLVDMFYCELGSINITEIIQNGGELDLNWKPKTLAEVRKNR